MSCACDANRHLQLGTRTDPSQLPAPCGHPSRAPVPGRQYDDDLDAKASAQGDHPAIATAASLGWRWRRSSFRPAHMRSDRLVQASSLQRPLLFPTLAARAQPASVVEVGVASDLCTMIFLFFSFRCAAHGDDWRWTLVGRH